MRLKLLAVVDWLDQFQPSAERTVHEEVELPRCQIGDAAAELIQKLAAQPVAVLALLEVTVVEDAVGDVAVMRMPHEEPDGLGKQPEPALIGPLERNVVRAPLREVDRRLQPGALWSGELALDAGLLQPLLDERVGRVELVVADQRRHMLRVGRVPRRRLGIHRDPVRGERQQPIPLTARAEEIRQRAAQRFVFVVGPFDFAVDLVPQPFLGVVVLPGVPHPLRDILLPVDVPRSLLDHCLP